MMQRITKWINQKKNIVFLVILFLIGLIMLPPYGAHLDQETEIDIMYMSVRTCMEAFDATEGGLYEKIVGQGIPPVQESFEQDHGMAMCYPLIGIIFLNEKAPAWGNLLLHTYIYFCAFAGFGVIFFSSFFTFNSPYY